MSTIYIVSECSSETVEESGRVLKMSAVYLLLLLVLGCSLLEGQSVRVNSITLRGSEDRGDRENEIQAAENPTTEATTTTSSQQSCQQDIHSVLREMSAVLAELKVEQRHTTTAVNNLESRLRASESQVEELKKKSEGKSWSMLCVLVDEIPVLSHFIYNSGIFTAPVRGVYEFKIYIFGLGGRTVSVSLQKNGHHVTIAHVHQQPNEANSSNGVSLLLEVGDVVCVKVRADAWVHDSTFHHTTFSGQMLFSV
ncbi:complement C1q-like protein 2 [Astyanax mexicanus]|uniref:Complement C1q-like protein 2 n=1 Tax=Astyanax mexicanus TaxID=7994 RepID=A0A8T2MK18_ASTMX|nr:complement C1q-like protein 2 [Astyanax mexicanus]